MKLRIREKLLGGFAIVLLLLAAIAILSVTRLNQSADRTQQLYEDNALGIQAALTINQNMIASAREEKRAFLASDDAARDALVEQSREEMEVAQAALAAYE
ncbi:MAG: MCP four helix bundle domain-containing protein, partial [Caldilineales bacterium]|nr:MCP four helix bundle domain-containing protein [Caldilineales bacterium]